MSNAVNRIGILGSLITSLGFFFLPLVELKPNRLASGIPFQLLQLEGDLRYVMLFLLALAPLLAALRDRDEARGWLLVGIGNALLFLTLYLGAYAGRDLIDNASTLLGESVNLRNPRLLPSAAIALGVLGGYVVLFAGLRDLSVAGVGAVSKLVAAWSGVGLVVLLLINGYFDIYSVLVEFEARGGTLGQRTIEHLMFVVIALLVGFALGVGLGLWAYRDARTAPVILYTVGIIQTVPSLALFGVLLIPLSRLGDQSAWRVFWVWVILLLLAAASIYGYQRFVDNLKGNLRQVVLVTTATLSALPLTLFVVVLVSFLFRVLFIVFTSEDMLFANYRTLLVSVLGAALGLWVLDRFVKSKRWHTLSHYGSVGGFILFTGILLVAVIAGSQQFLQRVDLADGLTIRNLGVSGIGTAPAVIALTLYSLLPMVRNTYAGLNNVDAAIIDSGKGMGMTPSQRFFQIELPIAIPVIMAGVRNAAVSLVGIGAVASVIGAGGLGDFILQGIINTSIDQILLGAIPAILLATLLDAGLRGLERVLTSPGIRHL
ncbi:MAG: ABC transporter permease [Deinococcota bacterium]